jgi:hypothetical protein
MATLLTPSLEADIQAISRLKGLYCDTIDRIIRDKQPGDENILRSIFTEDAVIDFTQLDGNIYEGRQAIMRLFCQTMPSATGWMWHSTGAEAIEADGDTATGKWTLYAMALRVGDMTSPPFATYGRYIDEFRRVNGQWRQSRLFFLNETKNRG